MGHKLSHWILTTALWGGKLRFQKGGKKKKTARGGRTRIQVQGYPTLKHMLCIQELGWLKGRSYSLGLLGLLQSHSAKGLCRFSCSSPRGRD
jgi:hypothetical protein